MSDNDKNIPLENMAEMEDIVSTSPTAKVNGPVEEYTKGVAKGLGGIIKGIAFLVSFAVLAVFLLAAYLLYTKDPLFTAIAIGIVIFGVIVATIVLFLIYGMGQIICQNNEILKRLNNRY